MGPPAFELLGIDQPVPPGPVWTPFRVSTHSLAWLMVAGAKQLVQEITWKGGCRRGYAPATALRRLPADLETTVEEIHGGRWTASLVRDEDRLFAPPKPSSAPSGQRS
jgi:hypothetical protein